MAGFRFKQFSIEQDDVAMKVGTDGVLLGAWANSDNAKRILDIGTGTGVIALQMAQRNAEAQIHAVEIDAEERIQIEMTNNGSAIPAEVAENIFTPFFTTKADGSGIGLAVSRQIIRLHGGSLRLKHNDEGRVTFAIVME